MRVRVERTARIESSRTNGTRRSRMAGTWPSSFQAISATVAASTADLALAVVAAAAGLEHGRAADRGDRAAQLRDVVDLVVLGGADAELREELLLGQPVLRDRQRRARRPDLDLALEPLDGGGRHVLELPRHDVALGRQRIERGAVVVGGDAQRADLAGAGGGVGVEQRQSRRPAGAPTGRACGRAGRRRARRPSRALARVGPVEHRVASGRPASAAAPPGSRGVRGRRWPRPAAPR